MLLDLSLGKANGIELVKDIQVRYPQLLVLVHSMHEDSVYAARSLRAGARGYVAKSDPSENPVGGYPPVLTGRDLPERILDQRDSPHANRRRAPAGALRLVARSATGNSRCLK